MFKVDDGFYDHPKVRSIPRGAARDAAVALWTLAGSWCDKHKKDGMLPADQVEELHCKRKAAEWLVAAQLWHASGPDHPTRALHLPRLDPVQRDESADRHPP
jgi:hypothetical protein